MCDQRKPEPPPLTQYQRGEEICKTLRAVEDLLTEHVQGPQDLREHSRKLRNLQVHVAWLNKELGIQ